MSQALMSITNVDLSVDVDTNKSDIVASVLKGIVGAVPFAGGILAEIITVSIPNQKQARIANFMEIFGYKIKYLEEAILAEKMKTEEFKDLLEDVIRDASRALTPERREYLASLLKNSITREELDHLGHKKILDELNTLNDAEIIILKYHFIRDEKEREEYQKKHDHIITFRKPGDGATETERQRSMILRSYHKTLENRELTPADLNEDNFGELLLKYIDIFD